MKMPVTSTRKISLFSVFIDLLIDLAFMVIGFLIYYHFLVNPLIFIDQDVTVTISPILTNLVGGFHNAVYIMAGLPFLIGFFGLVRLVIRLLQGLTAAARKV
jgi:hypothetical protein